MQSNKTVIDNPMSESLINKYLDGNSNIKTMAEISRMRSLEQVLNGNDHCIIFTATTAENAGHWQLLYVSNGILTFFDSYGMTPNGLIDRMMSAGMNMYGQTNNLSKLIEQSKYYPQRACYNGYKYQQDGSPATCGRYCVLNLVLRHIYSQKNQPYNSSVFHQIMVGWKQKFKLSYDSIVSSMINKLSS